MVFEESEQMKMEVPRPFEDDEDEEEEVVPVKKKPFLFGAVDSGNYWLLIVIHLRPCFLISAGEIIFSILTALNILQLPASLLICWDFCCWI